MSKIDAPTVTMPIITLSGKRLCPACGGQAEAHQPDVRLPDRLLLTCGGCGCWTLLVCRPEIAEILGVRLPDGITVVDRAG